MTYRRTIRLTGLALAGALASTGAFASGTHAGGHAGDDHNAAIGQPGEAAKVQRTVQVDMTDTMRFSPATIDVKQNETVRFVVKNVGKVRHEMVLGSLEDLKAHYAAMLKFPNMEHAEPNMVTLDGGKTGELVWRFTKPGKVDFACLQPGHYDAGMKGVVAVAKVTGKSAHK